MAIRKKKPEQDDELEAKLKLDDEEDPSEEESEQKPAKIVPRKTQPKREEDEEDSEEGDFYQKDDFVVSDSEESDEAEKKKETLKKRRKKKNYELDEDDLDLVQSHKEENRKKLKKLEPNTFVKKADEESQSYQDEEDDSFIEKKKKGSAFSRKKRGATGMDIEKEGEESEEEDNSLEMDRQANDFVFRDLLEREEIKDKFLGVEDLKIINLNGPERYFNRSWDEHSGQSMAREEAEWIARQMRKSQQGFSDLHTAVSEVLKMIQISNHEILYIHLYKRQSFEPFVEKNESYEFQDLLKDKKRLNENQTANPMPEGMPRGRRMRDRLMEEESDGEVQEDLREGKNLGLRQLWQIYDLDIEWSGLMRKKAYFDQLKHKVEALRVRFPEIAEPENYHDIKHIDYYIDYLLYQLRKRLTPEEYEEMKRMEHLMVEESLIAQNSYKSLVRTTFAHQAFTCELPELVYRFLLTPGQLAAHLAMSARRDASSLRTTTRPNTPLEAPRNWFSKKVNETSSLMKTPERVQQSVIRFAAEELFYFPSIKLHLKSDYFNIVRISTEPTSRGRKDVDIYSMYFPVKRLKDLKLEDLIESKAHARQGCLWLLMKQAEKKGYINIHFKTEWDTNFKDSATANTIFMDLGYKSHDKGSEFGKQWDELREQVFDYLVKNLCLPSFENELQAQLNEQGEKFIIEECSKKFRKMINLQPSLSNGERELDVFDPVSYMSVMGITLDPNNPGHVACVLLDKDGEYKGELLLKNFVKRRFSTNTLSAEGYERDLELLKAYVNIHYPEKIVIGSNCIQASYLKANVVEMLGSNGKSESVCYGDMTVPSIWAKTEKAFSAFPESNFLVRQAISLGRMAQDPTAEVLGLWHVHPQKNGLTYLNLHPLQEMVPLPKLLAAYEKIAMEIVNKAGVDLNRAVSHEHLQAPLMFVCGLGPRKVSHLVSEIKTKWNGLMVNRKQLEQISCLRPMKDLAAEKSQKFPVYKNAVGFLKIMVDAADERVAASKKEAYKTSEYMDEEETMIGIHILDRTRIHPSMYQVAEKIARHLLKTPESDPKSPQEIFRDVMKMRLATMDQDRMDRIMKEIESYIQNSYTQLQRNIRNYVNLVMHELMHPFKDYRPTAQAVLDRFASVASMSRISPWVMARGSLVDVMIRNVVIQNKENLDDASGRRNNDFLSVVTDQGIPGTVDLSDFQDSKALDKEDLYKKFVSGSYITCKIKDINNTNMKLTLSANLDEINSIDERLNFIEAVYGIERKKLIFDGMEDFKKYNPDGEQKKALFVPRSITHPNFKNYSYQQALTVIKKKQMGDFIIRPSSSHKNGLAVVWLIFPENVVNLTLMEGPKGPNESISKELSLANGREKFGSLDEFINNYIKKVNAYVEGIARHNKFFPSKDNQGVDEELRKVKGEYDKKSEKLTPYLFSFRQEVQQYLILSYLLNDEIKREYIKLKPRGLSFHGEEFQDLTALIQFFKKNFHSAEYQRWATKVAKEMNEHSASVLTTRNTQHPFSRYDGNKSVERWNGAASVHGGNTPRPGGFGGNRGGFNDRGRRGGERGGMMSRDRDFSQNQSRSRSQEKRRPYGGGRENQRDWARGGETPVNRFVNHQDGEEKSQGWGNASGGWEAADSGQVQSPEPTDSW